METMQNKNSNNLFESVHFATATIKSLQYKKFFLSDKPWPLKYVTLEKYPVSMHYNIAEPDKAYDKCKPSP